MFTSSRSEFRNQLNDGGRIFEACFSNCNVYFSFQSVTKFLLKSISEWILILLFLDLIFGSIRH